MSRFVSAGADGQPAEHDDAWVRAQEAIEATRRTKADAGQQDGGKSLYETLQANKAAKQEAFEESIRLRNQFRSLDEDEVEYLDSVLESTRAQEAAVKKETSAQLSAFRKLQEDAERAARGAETADAPETAEQPSWSVGRKRKKGKEDVFGGVKLRKSSTTEKKAELSTASTPQTKDAEKPSGSLTANLSEPASSKELSKGDTIVPVASPSTAASSQPKPAISVGLGLGAYSSDEDD